MIYLLLYIVFSSVFTLCIKWVYNRGSEDIITIGAINYICAAITVAPWFFSNDVALISDSSEGNLDSFYAIMTGSVMGLVYFVAFFFVIYCVRQVGASSTTVVGSLSLLMPIIVAALVWNSSPNAIQIAGIGLALVSLLLIAVKPSKPIPDPRLGLESANQETDLKRGANWVQPALLLGFFLLCGMSRVSQEAFKFLSEPEHRPTYLFAAFLVSATPSLVLLAYRRRKILRMEWVVGTIMGVSNILQTYLILMALNGIAGYIVFPVSSAGGIAFTTLVATQLMGERLSSRAYVGIAMAVVALVFLKWELAPSDVAAIWDAVDIFH